jgi:hypothetical protein
VHHAGGSLHTEEPRQQGATNTLECGICANLGSGRTHKGQTAAACILMTQAGFILPLCKTSHKHFPY